MRTIREDDPIRGIIYFVETTYEEGGKDFAQRHGPFLTLEDAQQFRTEWGESMTESEKVELALRRAWTGDVLPPSNPPTVKAFVEAFIAELTAVNTGTTTRNRDALETERK